MNLHKPPTNKTTLNFEINLASGAQCHLVVWSHRVVFVLFITLLDISMTDDKVALVTLKLRCVKMGTVCVWLKVMTEITTKLQ